MVEELAEILTTKLGLEANVWGVWLQIALSVGIVATAFLPGISLIAMFSIWWERKVAGHIQSRLGPMHVGGWHGWAQSIADGVKLILKEDLIPQQADPFLFRLAPYLAFAPVFAAFVAIPFGPQFVFEKGLNIGVLYLLAVLSVEVMGTILAGWGSASKWAIYGAMREACQIVSYEIPLGIAILCGVLVAGTLNMLELSYLQGGGLSNWFVFHSPFLMAAFLLYYIASIASNKRAPFDLPESESELVAGFHTEYSGLRFSFFFFAEYAGMFVIGAIQSMLFLGGWNSPFGSYDPVYMMLGYDAVVAGQAFFEGTVSAAGGLNATATAMQLNSGFALIVLNLYCMLWVVLKTFTLVFTLIWLRWTLPRIRIDQVLYACVKVLLPLSLVVLTFNAVWVAFVDTPVPGFEVEPIRLTHLVGPISGVQHFTQILMSVIGIGFVAWMGGIVLWAFIHRDKQPRKTLFPDVMPVGREVCFTDEQAAEAEPEPAG
ncbi:MAG: complex I subunit 1 family protein [Phycisphaeraceae bacterium]